MVATVGDAVQESLVTKSDLENALKPMVTKEYLEQYLEECFDKRLAPMVTKTDLVVSQQRMTIVLGVLMASGISILAAIDGLL